MSCVFSADPMHRRCRAKLCVFTLNKSSSCRLSEEQSVSLWLFRIAYYHTTHTSSKYSVHGISVTVWLKHANIHLMWLMMDPSSCLRWFTSRALGSKLSALAGLGFRCSKSGKIRGSLDCTDRLLMVLKDSVCDRCQRDVFISAVCMCVRVVSTFSSKHSSVITHH